MLVHILCRFVRAFVHIYELLLVARAISSWLPVDYSNPILQFLYSVTEPLLTPIRKLLFRIPALANFPIDFSMIVLFLLLEFLQTLLLF